MALAIWITVLAPPENGAQGAARKWDQRFESALLQGRVCEPSVPLGFRDRDILELIGKVAVTPCHRMVNAVA
jgi:hypothetical protein